MEGVRDSLLQRQLPLPEPVGWRPHSEGSDLPVLSNTNLELLHASLGSMKCDSPAEDIVLRADKVRLADCDTR